MSEQLPDRVIVLDNETGKLIVCALSIVQEGIPIYRMIPGKNYEHTVDAIRGASYKPQVQEEKKT